MDNFIIAFILLLGLVFISRILNEKANKKLDQEKKAQLIDLFSKRRIYSFGILIVIIVLFLVFMNYKLFDPFYTYLGYIITLIGYLIISNIHTYRILKRNNFPDFYIRTQLLSSSILLIGVIVFFTFVKF